MGDERGRQREGLERWCPRTAIRTAMPPAAAMVTTLSAFLTENPIIVNTRGIVRFAKTPQACSRTAALSGCVFMTASVACRGKGGMEVIKILLSLVGLGSE